MSSQTQRAGQAGGQRAAAPYAPRAAATPPARQRVAAIILNFKRPAETLACLQSLAAQTLRPFSVTVLDYDSSGQGAAAAPSAMAAEWQLAWPGLDLVTLRDNRGYAGNNNVGLRRALQGPADWLLLLNDDVVLDPDCLAELLAASSADARIGMLGPLVLHSQPRGTVQSAGGRLTANWSAVHIGQDEPDNGQFSQPSDVDWLSGCALLARREVVETAGLLDERYFLYFEETDWCLRAARHGWRLVNAPRARVWHAGVRPNARPRPAVTYYNYRNRYLLLSLHRAPARVALSAAAHSLRTLLSWSLRPKWRHLRPHRDALWHALVDAARGRWGAGRYGEG